MEGEASLTKKEKREIRLQERESESSTAKRKNTVRRLGIWGGVILGLGVLIYGLAQLGSGNQTPGDGLLVTEVNQGDWTKGNLDSQVVLVEFGDFQCPACASYHPLIDKLIKEQGDKFKFVYRHYPIKNIHPNAEAAARASEAAGAQGKFWEMYDLLYQNQKSWSSLPRSSADNKFADYAKQLGLDEAKFKTDFESDAAKDKVSSQHADGDSSGVNSTPTFFVNGKKIVNPQSYEQFVEIISSANSGNKATATP